MINTESLSPPQQKLKTLLDQVTVSINTKEKFTEGFEHSLWKIKVARAFGKEGITVKSVEVYSYREIYDGVYSLNVRLILTDPFPLNKINSFLGPNAFIASSQRISESIPWLQVSNDLVLSNIIHTK